MHRWQNWFIGMFLLCIAPALTLAQAADCPEIVERALQAADVLCAQTGRNQACYGSVSIEALAQPDAENFRFEVVGDLAQLADLQTLTLSPMDTATGAWGVALLRLQANIPDTLPGQNVTFLLFGDVELTNAVAPGDEALRPMQAFYLRTGVADAPCEEAPESGLLVQTPEGVSEINFTVNGVEVDMGSTVFFQADEDEGMTVSTLEGAASVSTADGAQPIIPGTWVRIPILRSAVAAPGLVVPPGQTPEQTRAFEPGGPPELPRSYEGRLSLLRALPLRLLERRIEIAAPLAEAALQRVHQRLQDGLPLCGEDGLPACDRYPFLERIAASVPCIDAAQLPGRLGDRLPDLLVCPTSVAPAATPEIIAPNTGDNTNTNDNESGDDRGGRDNGDDDGGGRGGEDDDD